MNTKLLTAVILLSVSAPSFAADQAVRYHRYHAASARDETFLHNYGPPDFYPGTNIPPDRVVYPVTGQPYGILRRIRPVLRAIVGKLPGPGRSALSL